MEEVIERCYRPGDSPFERAIKWAEECGRHDLKILHSLATELFSFSENQVPRWLQFSSFSSRVCGICGIFGSSRFTGISRSDDGLKCFDSIRVDSR